MSAPPLVLRERPGLSETLTGPKAPDRCQNCGAGPDATGAHASTTLELAGWLGLQRWIECDAWDQETSVVVVLCDRCSDRLVNPHPRLYKSISYDEPRPGCMAFCLDCQLRDGVRCTSPDAKANGGAGVRLGFSTPPSQAIICGRGRGGGKRSHWITMYGQVIRCRQKVTA